ncbi:MAG: CoA-acylating methylmalonate-semialdehyde dehydrogenase [Bradymonadales bacterium]|nr:CoA-acylating methylmalonate-semialdehyde dehydrogenase [Bradymonadales bacterium]
MSDNPHLLPEVKKHYGRITNFVNNEFVESDAERHLDVTNPATNETIAQVPLATAEEVDRVVQAAAEAFEEWRETPPHYRTQPFYRLKVLMEKNYEEIARVLVQEHGKVIDEARGSVRRAIDNIEFACSIPSLMMGETLEDGAAAGIDEEVIRQPVGVFACVAPFNFPAMVPFWFWPAAVACGNTYVVKPSEQVPITQNYIFRLIQEAGFPDGVVNMVNGDKETVTALLTHPLIRGISFVGSTPVGRIIYDTGSTHHKRVQCQAGAKNYVTVMPDANLDACLPNMISSFFGNTGQRCLAGANLVLVGDGANRMVERFVEAARRIRMGYGLDETVQMGPVISHRSRQRILGFIEQGLAQGGKLLLDGRNPKVEGYAEGAFVGPTIFDQVTPDMPIVKEEIFGPVVTILRVKSLAEAIDLVNGSPYGNASSIYTTSGKAARQYRYRVNAGNIGVNLGIAAPMAFFPFGGQKDSFFGDLHGQAKDGINFCTDRKVVITRWV